MSSIKYKEFFSYCLGEMDDLDLAYNPDEITDELMVEWLHKTISEPHVRRLFTLLKMKDDIFQMEYTMRYSVDEETDKNFILNVVGKGMMLKWLAPQIRSKDNVAQMFAGKSQNFYSQSNHMTAVGKIYEVAVREQNKLVKDWSSTYNTYLGVTT